MLPNNMFIFANPSQIFMITFPSSHLKRRLQSKKEEIFDEIRMKYVVNTPEEVVRQSMIQYLLKEKLYPKGVIAVEYSINLNGLHKRIDILIHSATGKAAILIECKSPQTPINQLVLDQASRYNQVVEAPYICLYNGLSLWLFQLNPISRNYTQIKDFPHYKNL